MKEYASSQSKVILRQLFDDNQILLAYTNTQNLKRVSPEEFNDNFEILDPKAEELLRKQFLSDNNTL